MDPFFNSHEMKILGSLGIIAVLSLIRQMLGKLVNRSIEDVADRALWRQILNFLFTVLIMLLLVRIWFEWFQSVLTLLSVIAAAITIVSKEIILNILSYTIIIWRHLFKIGDRIHINGTTGDVVQLGLMYLTVVEVNGDNDLASGRMVKVPNKDILDRHVVNLSRGLNLIWHEFKLNMPLGVNWEKAVAILEGILAKYSYQLTEKDLEKVRDRSEELMFLDVHPKVFLKVEDTKYVLTCRLLCKCGEIRAVMDRLWRDILAAIAAEEEVFLEKPASDTTKVKADS